jgi:hypothetical protein
MMIMFLFDEYSLRFYHIIVGIFYVGSRVTDVMRMVGRLSSFLMNCTFNTFLYKFVSNFIKYSIITVIYFFLLFFANQLGA